MRAVDYPERSLCQEAWEWVQTTVGLQLPFAITEFEEGRRWVWRVGGLPAASYGVSTMPILGGCEAVHRASGARSVSWSPS